MVIRMYSIHIEFENGSNPYVRYNMNSAEYKKEFRKWSEEYDLSKLYMIGTIIYYSAKEKTRK